MDFINLVNPNDIYSFKYEISHFPDGQHSFKLIESESRYYTFDVLREHAKKHSITIKSRLNSFEDLEIILCATQALKNLGIKRIRLYIPYCLGGRSDRKFVKGSINYIKDIIAPIINLQGYEEVEIMDPHSDVLEACINNFSKIGTEKLLNFTFRDYFLSKGHKTWKQENVDNILLVSPDAGALKKIYGVAQYIGYQSDIIVATKYRNPITGQIEKTDVPLNITTEYCDKDIFIVDDICDGGRTFIEVAKAIKSEKRFIGEIYLIVTHGIFSYGFEGLTDYISGIYTTNSVKDIQDGTIVNTFSKHKTIHNFVKQLNVF
jgi:ribose-phosphate pyrophosphokinase